MPDPVAFPARWWAHLSPVPQRMLPFPLRPRALGLFALIAFELVCHPEQRAEDDGAIIAGQVHDASLDDEAAEFDQVPRALAALDLPCAHIMPRPCCLLTVARRPVAPERRQCGAQLPVQFAAPGSERTRLRAWPMPPSFRRPLVSVSTISAPASSSTLSICPGGDDQFAEPLHLAALEVARLVLKCFQFSIKVPWLAHLVSVGVDGEMIVEPPAQCCKVARTTWDGVVPPENFSREGALIRRSDVRFAVPLI